jgi:hypothetical protein
MTENEMIASVSEMKTVPVEEDNKSKYYATNPYLRTCPVCRKVFNATPGWAYRKDSKWYCCYTHYVEGGGDGGMDRVKGKKVRFYNNTVKGGR